MRKHYMLPVMVVVGYYALAAGEVQIMLDGSAGAASAGKIAKAETAVAH